MVLSNCVLKTSPKQKIGPNFLDCLKKKKIGQKNLFSPKKNFGPKTDRLIHSSFCLESSGHCISQTGRAREVKFKRIFTSNHMSQVTCHMSQVICHVSCVKCQVSHFFFYKVVELVLGGCVINRAYPV